MSDRIERIIRIYRGDTGTHPIKATVTDQPASLPILLNGGNIDGELRLSWSEWAEVSDHIERCRADRPAPDHATDDGWSACGAMPGLVPYEPLPCILARGHGTHSDHGVEDHCDRLGGRWL